MCGGTSKIPKLKKSVTSLFTAHNSQVEVLSSLSPDEVLAMGAAAQASLLTEPLSLQGVSPQLQATSGSLVFLTSLGDEGADPVVLVPEDCPIPVRRSHHMTLSKDVCKISVKMFLRHESGTLQELGEVSKIYPEKFARILQIFQKFQFESSSSFLNSTAGGF